MIKVLVVDDSAFMRQLIGDILTSDPGITVEKARNGKEALEKIAVYQPDVVTLDIEMPVMDGIQALEEIMKTSKTPVLMLSSLTQVGADKTLQALQLGAVDFIGKPSGTISLDLENKKDEILAKVKIAAAQGKVKPTLLPKPKPSAVPRIAPASDTELKKLVIIGTSTGGPKALYDIMPMFPAAFDAGILIVQHMPPGFTKSLAERLNTYSAIEVKEAENDEEIRSGVAYIAPGDRHLLVEAKRKGSLRTLSTKLANSPLRGGHRPAVNEMFESVAQQWWGRLVAVIMTGMGNDGTESLAVVKKRGAKVIAEDKSTCVVYGMPRAAYESGNVDIVAPLNQIVPEILKNI